MIMYCGAKKDNLFDTEEEEKKANLIDNKN
jgi:hypothetical protein